MTLHVNIISSVGLIFDIGGVLLLFKFGLSSEISEVVNLIDEPTPEEQLEMYTKNKHIRRMARLGLLLLIFLGFLLQLIGANFSIK